MVKLWWVSKWRWKFYSAILYSRGYIQPIMLQRACSQSSTCCLTHIRRDIAANTHDGSLIIQPDDVCWSTICRCYATSIRHKSQKRRLQMICKTGCIREACCAGNPEVNQASMCALIYSCQWRCQHCSCCSWTCRDNDTVKLLLAPLVCHCAIICYRCHRRPQLNVNTCALHCSLKQSSHSIW